jgi:hypothetical protein
MLVPEARLNIRSVAVGEGCRLPPEEFDQDSGRGGDHGLHLLPRPRRGAGLIVMLRRRNRAATRLRGLSMILA